MADDPLAGVPISELVERLNAVLDRQEGAIQRVVVQEIAGAGPHGLNADDHGGKRLRFSNGSSTATIIVYLPADAPIGTVLLPRQAGNAPLKFLPQPGATISPSQAGHNGTSGPNACVALTCEAAGVWLLDGMTAAVA